MKMTLFKIVGALALIFAFQLLIERAVTQAAQTATLTVKVTGLANAQGSARVALTNSAKNFPGEDGALQKLASVIKDGAATVTFKNLAPGDYAVSAYHDANDNNTFDKNMLGVPKESWGVSNNPKRGLRPPKYDEAKFTVKAGSNTIEIQIK